LKLSIKSGVHKQSCGSGAERRESFGYFAVQTIEPESLFVKVAKSVERFDADNRPASVSA
jgi:hypothetical protein